MSGSGGAATLGLTTTGGMTGPTLPGNGKRSSSGANGPNRSSGHWFSESATNMTTRYINGFVQECSNSSVIAMELMQSWASH